jgi:hypothetical protein
MSDEHNPALSVIVISPDTYQTVARTIRRVRAQNVCAQLEIVLVLPSAASAGGEGNDLAGFCRNQVVEVGEMTSTARARAEGVRRATAPVVAFVEDHSFPAKGWAEALIRAHHEPWAAVGPAIANANPRSLVSWVNLIIEYAEWMEPVPAGIVSHLPGHNGSYKRELLLEYGDRLEQMLEAESILQWDLREKGHKLYLEPAARTYHQNFSALASWIPLRLDGGRLFASARARNWPFWRRLLYAASSPLIPFVRFGRIIRELKQPGRAPGLLPRVLPLLFLGLVVDGMGEMIGYAFGVGQAMKRLSDMEFHRERYLTHRDRLADVEG